MAVSVLASGCDFLGTPAGYSDEGSVIATTALGGFSDPAGDISDTRPNTDMTFAGRYIARPGAGTGLVTAAEVTNLNAAGVGVVFLCENVNIQSPTAFTSHTQAYDQGQSDATTCQNNLQSVIGTSSWPVYFAVDYDYEVSTTDFMPTYLAGAASVMGVANMGVYGDGAIFNEASPDVTYFWQSASIGFSGNGSYVVLASGQAQNLWQWPGGFGDSGYPPLTPNPVPPGGFNLTGSWGTAAVDGDCAFDVFGNGWYGQYPKPGTTVGTLNTIPTITSTPTFSEPLKQTLAVPLNRYDQVVYSNTIVKDSFSVTNGVGSFSVNTNVGQWAYPFGNFSTDGGNTWQDYGFSFAGDFGYYYGDTLPDWVVQPTVSDTGDITFNVAYPQGGSAIANFTFHIALLLIKNTLLSLPVPMASLPEVTQSTAFSNLVPGITPPYAAYRRIGSYYLGTFTNHDLAYSESGTYAHGLGEVPDLLFYQLDTSGSLNTAPSRWSSVGNISGDLGFAMDATNVYISFDTNTQKVVVRFYLDN